MSYLDYLAEEEGKEVCDLEGKGFFSYLLYPETGEMFVPDIFIKKEHRGTALFLEIKKEIIKIAYENKIISITGTVYLKDANREKFLKKLNFYNRLGFKPHCIRGEAVIVIMNTEV